MAVTRQDRTYKDYTSNPIPTSFFKCIPLPSYILQKNIMDKKRCRDGVTCVALYVLSYLVTAILYCLVSVVFGTAIPTSL